MQQILLWFQQAAQQAAQPAADPFLPTTLGGWATILGILAGAALAAWRFLMKPQRDALSAEAVTRENADMAESEDRKKADAQRDVVVRDIATAATTAIGRLEILERTMDRVSQSAIAMQDTVGLLADQVQASLAAQHELELARLRELGDIRERLGSIDAKIETRKETQ